MLSGRQPGNWHVAYCYSSLFKVAFKRESAGCTSGNSEPAVCTQSTSDRQLTPARRPTQGPAGDQPKDWRAPTNNWQARVLFDLCLNGGMLVVAALPGTGLACLMSEVAPVPLARGFTTGCTTFSSACVSSFRPRGVTVLSERQSRVT